MADAATHAQYERAAYLAQRWDADPYALHWAWRHERMADAAVQRAIAGAADHGGQSNDSL